MKNGGLRVDSLNLSAPMTDDVITDIISLNDFRQKEGRSDIRNEQDNGCGTPFWSVDGAICSLYTKRFSGVSCGVCVRSTLYPVRQNVGAQSRVYGVQKHVSTGKCVHTKYRLHSKARSECTRV